MFSQTRYCQALGIESDQIGLDAAANAEYSINIDKESGANAATYFSDYDKSYWVNIVTGGTSPESVEILVSGISLKKDGQYHLSFSCTAPEGTEIPIAVTDSDGKTVYFSDTFKSNGEKDSIRGRFYRSCFRSVRGIFHENRRQRLPQLYPVWSANGKNRLTFCTI